MNDGKTPYTENYNVSVDESLRAHVGGNLLCWKSQPRPAYRAGGRISNINAPPLGAFFGPDPLTGQCDPDYNIAKHRRMTIGRSRLRRSSTSSSHGSYANYNSLQATLQSKPDRITFLANYTFGKAMGIRDNYSGNGPSAGNTCIRSVSPQ